MRTTYLRNVAYGIEKGGTLAGRKWCRGNEVTDL
jgi:hypothetical protein